MLWRLTASRTARRRYQSCSPSSSASSAAFAAAEVAAARDDSDGSAAFSCPIRRDASTPCMVTEASPTAEGRHTEGRSTAPTVRKKYTFERIIAEIQRLTTRKVR